MQKAVSLSSGESEFYGSVSAAADGLYLKAGIEFILGSGDNLIVKLIGDSAAARGIQTRRGAGKVRHLEAKYLWLQAKTQDGTLQVASVGTKWNVADLGTKALSKCRIKFLLNLLSVRDECQDYALVGEEEVEEEYVKLRLKGVIRRIAHEVQDADGVSCARANQSAKKILRIELASSMVTGAAGSTVTDALSPEPNGLSYVLHDIAFVLCVLTVVMFVLLGMWTASQWVFKSCRRQPVQNSCASLAVQSAEDATAEVNSVYVWVTPNGRHFHKRACKWVINREVSRVTEDQALAAHYKVCHTCHALGSRRRRTTTSSSSQEVDAFQVERGAYSSTAARERRQSAQRTGR